MMTGKAFCLFDQRFSKVCCGFCAAAGVEILLNGLCSSGICGILKNGFNGFADTCGCRPAETKACAQLLCAACNSLFLTVLRKKNHRHAAEEAFRDGVHAAVREENIRLREHLKLIHTGKDLDIGRNFAQLIYADGFADGENRIARSDCLY